MELLPADYILLGAAVVLAGMGLFRGFSGVFAFVVGFAVAGAADFIGWSTFLAGFESVWTRALAAVVLYVVVFGLVRYLVKLAVGRVLSQPSDAVFGCVLGLLCGILLVWAVSMSPFLCEKSNIARMLNSHVSDEQRESVTGCVLGE